MSMFIEHLNKELYSSVMQNENQISIAPPKLSTQLIYPYLNLNSAFQYTK